MTTAVRIYATRLRADVLHAWKSAREIHLSFLRKVDAGLLYSQSHEVFSFYIHQFAEAPK